MMSIEEIGSAIATGHQMAADAVVEVGTIGADEASLRASSAILECVKDSSYQEANALLTAFIKTLLTMEDA